MAHVLEDGTDVPFPNTHCSVAESIAPHNIKWTYVLKRNGKTAELNSNISGILRIKGESGNSSLPSSQKSDSLSGLDKWASTFRETETNRRVVMTASCPAEPQSSGQAQGDSVLGRAASSRGNEVTNTARQLSDFISASSCLSTSKETSASIASSNNAYQETAAGDKQNNFLNSANMVIDVMSDTDNEELDTNGNVFTHAKKETPVSRKLDESVLPATNPDTPEKLNAKSTEGHQPSEKPYFCEKCGLGFEKMSYYTRHLKGKFHSMDSLECECEVCEQKNSPSMVASSKSTPSKSVYTCEVCGTVLNCPLLLRKHMCVHTSKNMCKVCGKKFMLVHKLHEHMLFHTGENKCRICGKTFMRSMSLEQHMFVHKDQKPFSCGICGKQFICEGGFKRHKYVHKLNTGASK